MFHNGQEKNKILIFENSITLKKNVTDFKYPLLLAVGKKNNNNTKMFFCHCFGFLAHCVLE